MRNGEAIMAKGKQVRVRGYKPARIGTIISFEWYGGRHGQKAMYVHIDFGRPLPGHETGIIGYKAKYLVMVD